MLSKRLIACLDVRNGCVVKGVNFEGLRTAGDPAELAKRYNAEGIDEVVVLDVTATIEGRRAFEDTIRAVSGELFIPLTVGGGIRSEPDAAAAIDAGADKVGVNSAALADPTLLTRLAARYGSQAVVVAIDAKRVGDRFQVFSRSGSTPTTRDAVEWAIEAESRGAGEAPDIHRSRRHPRRIRLRADGGRLQRGFHSGDCVRRGRDVRSLHRRFQGGLADAALAASVFHYSEHAVSELKRHLLEQVSPSDADSIDRSSGRQDRAACSG
jgi:cyclase